MKGSLRYHLALEFVLHLRVAFSCVNCHMYLKRAEKRLKNSFIWVHISIVLPFDVGPLAPFLLNASLLFNPRNIHFKPTFFIRCLFGGFTWRDLFIFLLFGVSLSLSPSKLFWSEAL